MLYWSIFFIIIFLFLLLMSQLNIKVLILQAGRKNEIVITFYLLWNLIKYRFEVPFFDFVIARDTYIDAQIGTEVELGDKEVIDDGDNSKIGIHQIEYAFKKLSYYYKKYKDAFSYFLNSSKISNLLWLTEVGSEDAAITAISTGAIWGIKSGLVAYINSKHRIEKSRINVSPYYGGVKLESSFDCIISIRLGYIIFTAIKILRIKKKERGW